MKKFVQTFVLAQQPTGYFVLNDIFRYINEEGEEEPVENAQDESAAAPATLVEDVEMPKAQPSTEDPVAPAVPALDTEVVDKKLEETVKEEAAVEETPATNGTAEDEEPVAASEPETAPEPEVAAKEVEEEVKEPEKPKDPVPTPAVTRQPSTTKAQAPTQPAAPPKPLSWASRAAAAVGSAPKPAVPVVAPKSTATPPAQARAAPPAAKPTQATPQPPATPNEKDKENAAPGSGWQTAGSDHAKRQNRPQSISSPPEKEGTMGYVRNVTDKVITEDLRGALAVHGQLVYFDINRTKVSKYPTVATSKLT